MKYVLQILCVTVLITGIVQGQITSAATGNWGDGATWTGGVVPGPTDNVSIESGHTVTINIVDAKCNDLNVSGYLYFAVTNGLGIVVNGSITVNGTGRIQAASANPTGQYYQTIEIKKDLTVNSGGRFDMRQSSSANLAVGRVVFSGNQNSSISLALNTYTSNTEEFNSVVINKTGGAKVILASGTLYQNNNATNGPDTLVLISGVIETGTNTWVHLATTAASIQGASQASYIHGKVGRGITNSGGNANREFPVGDATQYRPISVRVAGPANATGHYVWAQVLDGNANTGSSAFTGGIDKVSALRYYEVGYLQNLGSATAMPMYGFTPTFSSDDGVNAGNMDLRVATSADARATWKGVGPLTDTTDLSIVPSPIASDSISPSISVGTGTSLFVALARATGTTTNPLEPELPKFPVYAVDKTSLSFGALKINLSKKDSAVVTNSGDDTLKISAIVSSSTDFIVTPSSLTLAPSSTGKVFVTFAPTTVGAKSGKIILTHNAASSPDTLTLTGTGDPATSVRSDNYLPIEFIVHQNFPNPFNPETSISFEMPERAAVKVEIFSLLGNSIAVLYNGTMNVGTHTVQWNASNNPSGVYFYRVTMGTRTFTNRMILLK
jgi:hypothetical protein